MLTPEQLQNLPKELTDLYSQLTEFILRDIAQRIAKGAKITDTAEYQMYRARSLGLSEEDIAAKIAEINGTSADVIDKLIRDAAAKSDEFDRRMLGADDGAAVPLKDNKQLQKLMAAQIKETAGDCENITGTMGFADHDLIGRVYYLSMTDMYRKELDAAHMKVVTGATDYTTAVRQACNKLAASGVRTIDYESGRSDRVEVAVRRALMTSVSHITQRISEQNAEEFGADGWEISAHAGARPSHTIYQGRQYPNSQYDTIVRPLIEDYNCRHSAYPIIMGVSEPAYTEEELANIDPPPFTYEGRTYTAYEAQQQMRKMERAMRKQKDRCIVADAAGDKESFITASTRLNRQKYIYEDFCKAAGTYTEYERTFVVGQNRSIFVRAGKAAIDKEYRIIAQTLDKKDVPTLDDFKKMLYNNSDEYKQLRHKFNEFVIHSDYDDIKHLNGCLSDKVTRKWYVLHDKMIPDMIDTTKSVEEQARQAHAFRNQFRTNARDLMLNQDERQYLDKYKPNLTFEEQIKDKIDRNKAKTREEAILSILNSAPKSNKNVNDKFSIPD